MTAPHDYTIFHDFIRKFLPQGFNSISNHDAFIVEMESKLRDNHQFFYIGDLLRMKILFVSIGSLDIIGVDREQFNLSTFITRTKPSDMQRYSLARSTVIKTGYELLVKHGGTSLLSTHVQQKGPYGNFFNLLFQAYSFYSDTPHQTVFTLLVLTDLSSFKINTHGYHYYLGDDPAMFRYPDEDLLKIGNVFSDREFEIIRLIAVGLGSNQIADRLSLSINTVDTHRRNILKKTNKSTVQELVIELQETGIL